MAAVAVPAVIMSCYYGIVDRNIEYLEYKSRFDAEKPHSLASMTILFMCSIMMVQEPTATCH